MSYTPKPCTCAECRANRRRNARLTVILSRILIATAAITGWLILRCK